MAGMAVKAQELGATGGLEIIKNPVDERFKLGRLGYYARTMISSIDLNEEKHWFTTYAPYLT
jgi:hypothetical protein